MAARPPARATPRLREARPPEREPGASAPPGPAAAPERLLALQRGAGNAAVSGLLQRQGLWDAVGDIVGDITDSRPDEERLDAQEDLRAFMGRTYSEPNVKPSTGGGIFGVDYDPSAGRMDVTVRIAFEFVDGFILNPEWLAAVGGIAGVLASGWTLDQFVWADEEKVAWATSAVAAIQDVWSERYTFYSRRPHWEMLPPVDVVVNVVEAPATGDDAAQWVVQVNKWPDDASLTEAMSWPADRSGNRSTGTLHESSADAGGVEEPDVRHFPRTTRTRKRYGQVDTDNPGTILFDRDSSSVGAADVARLETFGRTLGADDMPPFPVTLTGRASSEGEPEHNRALSEDRARAVANVIVRAGAKKQPAIDAKGADGAAGTPDWRRVEIAVGTFESDQRTLTHEFGHMIGLDDEYPVPDPAPGDPDPDREVGERVGHSRLAERLIPGQRPVLAHHDEDIMSNGEVVRPHHYVTFLEALGLLTGTSGEWDVRPGPGHGGRGPGDFPVPAPGGTVTV